MLFCSQPKAVKFFFFFNSRQVCYDGALVYGEISKFLATSLSESSTNVDSVKASSSRRVLPFSLGSFSSLLERPSREEKNENPFERTAYTCGPSSRRTRLVSSRQQQKRVRSNAEKTKKKKANERCRETDGSLRSGRKSALKKNK